MLHATVLCREGLFVTCKILKDGLFLLGNSEVLIKDAQFYPSIITALTCCAAEGLGGRGAGQRSSSPSAMLIHHCRPIATGQVNDDVSLRLHQHRIPLAVRHRTIAVEDWSRSGVSRFADEDTYASH